MEIPRPTVPWQSRKSACLRHILLANGSFRNAKNASRVWPRRRIGYVRIGCNAKAKESRRSLQGHRRLLSPSSTLNIGPATVLGSCQARSEHTLGVILIRVEGRMTTGAGKTMGHASMDKTLISAIDPRYCGIPRAADPWTQKQKDVSGPIFPARRIPDRRTTKRLPPAKTVVP